jgi:hypothetical protein
MSEPINKDTPQWRDWFVRHNFGGLTAAMIKSTDNKESLEILIKFVKDIQDK